jgi:hypothetical protein
MGQVDWFLDQLRRREDHAEADRMNADPWRDLPADNYCIGREPGDPAVRVTAPSQQECADAWRDFPRQPGTRLSWVRPGFGRYELRTAEQQTIASFRELREVIAAGGRTFTWKRVTKSSWPEIAGTISNDLPGALAHILGREAGERC